LRFVALSLALSHGERGSGFSKSESRRIGNQMSGKPENVQARQPNSLSPWEKARERASKPQACLFGKRYGPVRPINPYPKASSCRIKPSHE